MLSSYRIQCMWKPDSDPSTMRGTLKRAGYKMPVATASSGAESRGGVGGGLRGIGPNTREEGYRVIAGLTLYKVQHNIYLLDFHKREGDQFTFMVSMSVLRVCMREMRSLLRRPGLQSTGRVVSVAKFVWFFLCFLCLMRRVLCTQA